MYWRVFVCYVLESVCLLCTGECLFVMYWRVFVCYVFEVNCLFVMCLRLTPVFPFPCARFLP